MPDIAQWQKYHATLYRSCRLAEIWVRDAVRHFRAHPRLTAASALLDFGCGYFDAGAALAPHVGRMDGLEIDDYSLRLARSRAAGFRNTAIHAANADVPAGGYDMIFANSVFQYLENDDAILRTLKQFHKWLKPGGETLLIDLIPTNYSPPRDAMRSMWVSTLHGVPLTMARFLWNAATSPHGRAWHRIDPPRLTALAKEAGFSCERLKRNLTPSLQRYSCELRLT